MTPDFIGTVEALLILRRWMKMTTSILIIRKDVIFAKARIPRMVVIIIITRGIIVVIN